MLLRSALLLAFATPRLALAEIPYRLSFSAPPECPQGDEFAQLVLERTTHGRVADPAEPARTMRVVILHDEDGYRGELRYHQGEGEYAREVRGGDCGELANAMALVVALAIDARSRSADVPLPELPWAVRATTWQQVRMPPLQPPIEWVEPLPEKEPARRTPWALGATVGGHTSHAPSAGPSVGLVVAASPRPTDRFDLELTWATSGRTEVQGERARFDAWTVMPTWCASIAVQRVRLALPCSGIEVGGVRGRGFSSPRVSSPAQVWLPWVALGLMMRVEWHPGRTWVGVGTGMVVPLYRPVFHFDFDDGSLDVFRTDELGMRFAVRFGFESDFVIRNQSARHGHNRWRW